MVNIEEIAAKVKVKMVGGASQRLIDKIIEPITDQIKKNLYQNVLANQSEVSILAAHNPTDLKDTRLYVMLAAKVLDRLQDLFKIIGVQSMSSEEMKLYTLQLSSKPLEETIPGLDVSLCLQLEVIALNIRAQSHPLQSCWTMELVQDLYTGLEMLHGVSFKEDIYEILAYEFAFGLINEIINDLCDLGKKHEHTEPITNIKQIAVLVAQQANDIAKNTQRGAGNKVVSDSIGADLFIKSMVGTAGVTFRKNDTSPTSAFSHVGDLLYAPDVNGELRVMYAVFSTTSPQLAPKDSTFRYLIGYQGTTNTDSGYFYAPHTIISPRGVFVDPKTFNVGMKFDTICGKATIDQSKHYYRTLEISPDIELLKEINEPV